MDFNRFSGGFGMQNGILVIFVVFHGFWKQNLNFHDFHENSRNSEKNMNFTKFWQSTYHTWKPKVLRIWRCKLWKNAKYKNNPKQTQPIIICKYMHNISNSFGSSRLLWWQACGVLRLGTYLALLPLWMQIAPMSSGKLHELGVMAQGLR